MDPQTDSAASPSDDSLASTFVPDSPPPLSDLEDLTTHVDLESIANPDDPALKYLPFRGKAGGKGLSFRTRATLLSIVVGMLPLMGVGLAAYYAANRALTQQGLKVQGDRTTGAANQVNRFLQDQAMALQLLANTPTLTTPRLLLLTPVPIKQSLLNRYLQVNRAYDSLALVSADGQARILAQAGREGIANNLSQNP
ncbi:MAG: hypothetical protein SFW36_06565, partial [Leptolyngbyaceae cyanobacterium bins.59]|nr:hypothetical protein [Leptolyngbyaceae cyanobacterium bins.59]